MSIQKEAWYKAALGRDLVDAQRAFERNPRDNAALAQWSKLLLRSGQSGVAESVQAVVNAVRSVLSPFHRICDDPPQCDTVWGAPMELMRQFRALKSILNMHLKRDWQSEGLPMGESEFRELIERHRVWVQEGLPEVERQLQKKRDTWFAENSEVEQTLRDRMAQLEAMAKQLPPKEEWGSTRSPGGRRRRHPHPAARVFRELQEAWQSSSRALERLTDSTRPPSYWTEEVQWSASYFDNAEKVFKEYQDGLTDDS